MSNELTIDEVYALVESLLRSDPKYLPGAPLTSHTTLRDAGLDSLGVLELAVACGDRVGRPADGSELQGSHTLAEVCTVFSGAKQS